MDESHFLVMIAGFLIYHVVVLYIGGDSLSVLGIIFLDLLTVHRPKSKSLFYFSFTTDTFSV